MGNTISRETWKKADNRDTKLNILFDLLCDNSKHIRQINEQIEQLKNRKRLDTVYSFAGGIIGGFSAMVAKMAIWRQ